MADRQREARARAPKAMMMLLSFLSLLLVAAPRALAARVPAPQQGGAQANAAGASGSDDFDFYFLVRQYPPTFCNDHRCSHSPPRGFAFTIHGLWPQRADGSWPEFCAGPDGGPGGGLSLWRLRDLLPALARQWPSWTTSDRQFWQHEWARHGACAAPALAGQGGGGKPLEPGRGQHAFFSTVLDLHSRYSVERALQRAGIEPSSSRRYAAADLVEAVRREHGVRPHVTCDFRGNLAEVWYCVAKDGKGAVDCGPDGSGGGGAGGGGGGGAAAAAALQAEEERRRRWRGGLATAAAGPSASSSYPISPPPSNANCRTVALPLPRARGAAEAAADEAPLVSLALAVLGAAAAVVARGAGGGGSGGGEARRPLIAAS